jgi:hypothetical protein
MKISHFRVQHVFEGKWDLFEIVQVVGCWLRTKRQP